MNVEAMPAERRHGEDCSCHRCRGFQPGNDIGRQFEVGNELARKSGVHASDLRFSCESRHAELVDWIRDTQPIGHPADEGAIARLAIVYQRLETLAGAQQEAELALEGRPLGAYLEGAEFLERLRLDQDRLLARAGRVEAELGRTPASRAKLGLHLALGRRAMTVVEMHAAAEAER